MFDINLDILKGLSMTISIHQIPDCGIQISHETCEIVSPSYLVKDNEVKAWICGTVSADAKGNDYTFSGSIEISCSLVCDKCLMEVVYNKYSELYEKFAKDGSEKCYQIINDELDFTEAIRAGICALLPMKILCTDECQGLCSMCGKNLNKESCECEKSLNPRFAQLSSFFKEEV